MNELTFPGQIETYKGKVRDLCIFRGVTVATTSNRISAFDVILPFEVAAKGAILNMITVFNMRQTEDIVPNCLLDVPTQNTAIWLKTTPFKFEMVVRAYNTGSFWRNYGKNKKNPWGYSQNVKQFGKFSKFLVTPATKENRPGKHDEDISFEEIIKLGLATKEECNSLRNIALQLFKRGQKLASKQGLILVDTKYEFGKDTNGKIYLIDEVHTPDSSRYWYKSDYEIALKQKRQPKSISKEFVREYLMANGFEGKDGQKLPEFSSEFIQSITTRYLELYKTFTGENLVLEERHEAHDYELILASLVKIRPQIEGPVVSIVMGSISDQKTVQPAINVLIRAGVPFEVGTVSAHRTPLKLMQYAIRLTDKGIQIIIAAAGAAAHLPGMIAAHTPLPVIGIPVKSSNSINGIDSLYSIVQMPAGVPVASMAIDGAENAALFALQILGLNDPRIKEYAQKHKEELIEKVAGMSLELAEKYFFQM